MKLIRNIVLSALASAALLSCRKSDANLDVDLSKYNPDITVSTDLDAWIGTTFTNPYNIEVVYRFNRNLADPSRDISPVDLANVTPTMNAVLNTFLQPYEDVAGKTFIRTYTPKQFVLFGSPSYNTNGSITLGTADGGRRVVLYEVNDFQENNPDYVKRPVRTIHHEFTHILNQNIAIPPDFTLVTKADYFTDWTNAVNTPAEAKSLGFVSQYARSSDTEDFAEMVSHLLVEGQVWFENYLATASPVAMTKLRKKEEIVIRYYKEYFDIDFKQLQAAVQASLKTIYNAKDPADLTLTLPIQLRDNKINTITYNPTADHYTTYGRSTAFHTLFEDYKASMLTNGWTVTQLQFIFVNATKMTFRVTFMQGAAGPYSADYDFEMLINSANGEVQLKKQVPEGTGTNYGNGGLGSVLPHFERFFLPYLVNRVFIADWLPATLPSTSPLYRTFGGFYVKGTPTNYFYGPVVRK